MKIKLFSKKQLTIHHFHNISSAHLAAGEGHLPCLKFIVCAGASIDHTLNARNDQVGCTHATLLKIKPVLASKRARNKQ